MKPRLLPFLVVLSVLTSGLSSAWGAHSFESMPYSDELEDGVDFDMCFTMDTIVPMPIPMDVETVAVTSSEAESGEATLSFHVTLAEPPLPHQSYTVEICVDVDRDPSTGAATPACFYNCQGADYDIGVEVQEGAVESVWVERYQDGAWVPAGEPTHDLLGQTVVVGVPVSTFGSPLESGVTVYLITEGGLGMDMAPGYGEPPMTFTFNYLPEAVFDAPESVDEGTAFKLDASASVSLNGAVNLYEWDLDGDGAYEESSPDATLSHQFADDGVYTVGLSVTDEAGFSSTHSTPITVVNTPPYDVVITQAGDLVEGGEVAFTGSASDLGEDQLTYSWDFGDGATAEGETAAHTYTDAGDYTVVLTVTDDDGADVTNEKGVQVTPTGTGVSDGEEEPEPEIDPLLVILVVFFGLGSFLIYDYIKNQDKKKKKKKKEPGDYCEEHPEVVEEENEKCEEAMWDLDEALGPIEEDLDAARDQWRQDMREVGHLIMEWDSAYAVIQSLTKSEAEIRESAEKVQKVAAIVKPGAGLGKTAYKKGGEEAMKEMGKQIATEVGKSFAGEVSQTVKDILSLEGWAMSEIGIGIAKFITGEDPQKEASDIRKKSMRTCTLLQSWVDHTLARTERYTHRTLHTCIDEAQDLIDRINDALKAFEDAVAGFRCVTCELTPEYMEHINGMINELNDFIRAFGDLIDQVEQRLEQAVALYNREDVYDSPYVRVNVQNNKIPNIERSLKQSAEAKK